MPHVALEDKASQLHARLISRSCKGVKPTSQPGLHTASLSRSALFAYQMDEGRVPLSDTETSPLVFFWQAFALGQVLDELCLHRALVSLAIHSPGDLAVAFEPTAFGRITCLVEASVCVC